MKNIEVARVADKVQQALKSSSAQANREVLETCYRCMDYTTLKETDSPERVAEFTKQVLEGMDKGLPPVASICVYPSLIEAVGVALTGHPRGEEIGITAVCGGFPSGQTFMEVKVLESAMAIENGADEVDAVLNVGAVLAGNYELVGSELSLLRDEIGEDAVLKVILETGSLADPELIYQAALIAMGAGADFIKTSTGKTPISATPAATVVMCQAIRDYGTLSGGHRVGIKVAGGISTVEDALLYYTIVQQELGPEWMNPDLFRIGTSRLLEALAPYLG